MVVKTHKKSMRSKRSSKKSKSHSGKKTMRGGSSSPKVPMSAKVPISSNLIAARARLKPVTSYTHKTGKNPVSRSKWPIGRGSYNPKAEPSVFTTTYNSLVKPGDSLSKNRAYSLAIVNAIRAKKNKTQRVSNYLKLIESGASFGKPNKPTK
jgi:hypothetical protein